MTEEIVKQFLSTGLAGAVALLALMAYKSERTENKELREKAAADAIARAPADEARAIGYAAGLREQSDKFAATIERITDETAKATKAIEDEHRRQEDELVDRLLAAVEKHAVNNGMVVEKVALLVDSVRGKVQGT